MVAFGREGFSLDRIFRRSPSLAQRGDTRPKPAGPSRYNERLARTSGIPLNEHWQSWWQHSPYYARLGTETRRSLNERDWAEDHEGDNFGYIVGGIIGLLFLIAVGIILYVRWKRRPKSTDSTTHYGRVVLPAPPNNQEDSLLRESWRPETVPEGQISFTMSPIWRNRMELHGTNVSGIIGNSIPARDGPTLVYLHPPELPGLQDHHSSHANLGANHEYPPPLNTLAFRPSMDTSNLSATDSDSLQVHVPWRESLRFMPGRLPTDEPEAIHTDQTSPDRGVASSTASPKGRNGLSRLQQRALTEAERESARPVSGSSERRNSVDSSAEGSETTSSLSSFARIKLKLTGSAPFLPLIEESSPLDTESLWARFRRTSVQSIPISTKSHSSRKSSVPKTSSPLSPNRKSTSTTSHLSSVTHFQPPGDTIGLTGIALNPLIHKDPSDAPVDRSDHPEGHPKSGIEPATHAEPVRSLEETPNLNQLNKEALYPTISESSSVPFSSSTQTMQFSPDMNANELSPTLNNVSLKEMSQEPRQHFKLTPDMPALTALPSPSSLWQPSFDTAANGVVDTSPSSLSLSDFPEPPVRRSYRPLPLRPLPHIPHTPALQSSMLTVQSRIPPVPKSQPPRPPTNAARPDFGTLPHVRRLLPSVDGHRRVVTAPYENHHDMNPLHKPTRSS